MRPTLFCPTRYNANFATLEYVDVEWGYKLVIWVCGKAQGHAWYATIYEAVLQIVSQGWQWASEAMKTIFEQDVLMVSL